MSRLPTGFGMIYDERPGASVYVIQANPLVHKIGLSDNPTRRMRQLASGQPRTLRLVGSWALDKPAKTERWAHLLLSSRLAGGEWFFATEAEAVLVVARAAEIAHGSKDAAANAAIIAALSNADPA